MTVIVDCGAPAQARRVAAWLRGRGVPASQGRKPVLAELVFVTLPFMRRANP